MTKNPKQTIQIAIHLKKSSNANPSQIFSDSSKHPNPPKSRSQNVKTATYKLLLIMTFLSALWLGTFSSIIWSTRVSRFLTQKWFIWVIALFLDLGITSLSNLKKLETSRTGLTLLFGLHAIVSSVCFSTLYLCLSRLRFNYALFDLFLTFVLMLVLAKITKGVPKLIWGVISSCLGTLAWVLLARLVILDSWSNLVLMLSLSCYLKLAVLCCFHFFYQRLVRTSSSWMNLLQIHCQIYFDVTSFCILRLVF